MNSLGKIAEAKAANYLRQKNYKIVDANYTTRFGEIDLIVKNSQYIVFVEVKMRNENSIAAPREFVDYRKQQRIILSSQLYLSLNHTDLQPRFDVIEVFTHNKKINSIKHLENAFTL